MIIEIQGINPEKMREIQEAKFLYRMDFADVTDIDGWTKTIVIGADTGEIQSLDSHPNRRVYRTGSRHNGWLDLSLRHPDQSSITLDGGSDDILNVLGVLLPVLNIDAGRVASISHFIDAEANKNMGGLLFALRALRKKKKEVD